MTGPLNYVGLAPTSDASLATFDWANTESTSVAVTTDFVNGVIAGIAPTLAIPSYVDSQVALRATKTQVNTDQANYVNASQKGVANGVATTDSNGTLTATQAPSGVPTENVAACYNVTTSGTTYLTSPYTVTHNDPTEYTAASITIPDLGFPYIPLPFVYIQGQSGGTQTGRTTGTTNYGMINVMPTPASGSATVYATGICTASPFLNYYAAVPSCNQYLVANGNAELILPSNPAITPTTIPPLTGGVTLNANLTCWGGTSFTFSNQGFVFFVLCVPAI